MTRRNQGRPNIPHLHEATVGCQNVVLANQKLPGFPILLSPFLGFSLHTLLHVTYIQSTSLNLLVIDVSIKYLSQPGNQTQQKKNQRQDLNPFPPSPTPQLANSPRHWQAIGWIHHLGRLCELYGVIGKLEEVSSLSEN